MRNTETDNGAIHVKKMHELKCPCNQGDAAFVVKREMKIHRQPLSFASKGFLYETCA